MNRHIELVEKWLNDNNSVSLEELKENRDDARAARATDAARAAAYDAAYAAARAATDAAHAAATDAAYAAASAAKVANCINKYKELTKEDV